MSIGKRTVIGRTYKEVSLEDKPDINKQYDVRQKIIDFICHCEMNRTRPTFQAICKIAGVDREIVLKILEQRAARTLDLHKRWKYEYDHPDAYFGSREDFEVQWE